MKVPVSTVVASSATTRWGTMTHPVVRPFVEQITVSSIGHAFGPVRNDVHQAPLHFVSDFLIDQSQSTGGGSALPGTIHLDLDKWSGYRYVITPPAD
jgi:hypothetical protein